MTEAIATEKGRKLDARFTLLDKLGAGGQGEVWRAHDGTRGIDIALKVLRPTGASQQEAWRTLEREYAIASRLDHPSILKVFPPERAGDAMVLPMELASGGDLRRLRGAGFLEIIPALLEIAQALEHAHERGVVHRDLKPGNVLFDARGRARLADFGVAETATAGTEGAVSATAESRDTNRHGFSPFTASPAQLRGEPPTPADDIYGLGALAYELLSGYPPYYPRFEKKRAIEEPVPTLVPTRQIPPLLAALVGNMLAKDPKRRPRTMREVIDELDAALNDTLTYEFETLPVVPKSVPGSSQSAKPQSSTADGVGASPAQPPQQAAANASEAKAFVWTPASRDRRANPERRGRRKEDLAPPRASQHEPSISWDQVAPLPAAPTEPFAITRGDHAPTATSVVSAPAVPPATGATATTPAPPVPPATAATPAPAPPATRFPPRSGAEALARIDAAIERAAAEAADHQDSSPPTERGISADVTPSRGPSPPHTSPEPGPMTPKEAAAIVAAARAAASPSAVQPDAAFPASSNASAARGTYADALPVRTVPMRANWESFSLDRFPKVDRYRPIRPRRWPWLVLGMVAGAAAAVYFLLPRFDPQTLPPEVAAVVAPLQTALKQAAASESSSSATPAAAEPNASSSTPAKVAALQTSPANQTTETNTTSSAATPNAADEQHLRAMRQTFDSKLAALEARGAGVWGGREFATAKTRAAESVGAHDAGNSRLAQERLTSALKLLDTVESKAPQALTQQVAAGEKALVTGQQEVAGQAFELARRINPSDRRASDGQHRAQSLNAVLPLLADAQNAEVAHDYARAAQDYSQALSLDPTNGTARAGQARSNAAFGDDNYAKAVGAGFAALGAGRLDEAHEAFVKARALKPNGAEASEGLRRVGAALTARGFASMRQRAAGLEAQERWDEALRAYEDVLAADPSLAFAQAGKARASSRAELSLRLQQLIDRSDRLASPGVREDARALLETARAQTPQGPVIRSQIARLEILLPGFDKPVRLSLLSDNSTQVVIPSIGSFGAFSRRDIELRPGKYTVVGTRYGFRDVRREITVAPGQEVQTIKVTCSEPI